MLHFGNASTQLEPDQNNTLQNLVREIQKITDYAPFLDKDIHIQIVGHTNKGGSEDTNMSLSQARADVVLSTLVSKGLKTNNLSAVGVGTKKPLGDEFTVEDKKINRSVSFNVILTDAPRRKSLAP